MLTVCTLKTWKYLQLFVQKVLFTLLNKAAVCESHNADDVCVLFHYVSEMKKKYPLLNKSVLSERVKRNIGLQYA